MKLLCYGRVNLPPPNLVKMNFQLLLLILILGLTIRISEAETENDSNSNEVIKAKRLSDGEEDVVST